MRGFAIAGEVGTTGIAHPVLGSARALAPAGHGRQDPARSGPSRTTLSFIYLAILPGSSPSSTPRHALMR